MFLLKNSILSATACACLALMLSVCWCAGHGAYHEELEHVDEQLMHAPNEAKLWFLRGALNVLHGEWQMALVDLEKADRLAPGKFDTDWQRGMALEVGGQPEAAKGVLDAFLYRFPEHGGALTSRARVLMKLKMAEAALADYRAGLSKTANVEPDQVEEVAKALMAARLDAEAADLLTVQIKRLGSIPALEVLALELEVRLGRIDLALTRVDALQKSAPTPEPWMARRAQVLAQAGRANAAHAAWISLRDHLLTLPNMKRGTPLLSQIMTQTRLALGESAPVPVNIPPAPLSSSL